MARDIEVGYDVFMNHRVGDPWNGDFVDFLISLSQKRVREAA